MTPFRGLEHIVRSEEPLAPYVWLRLGGPAEFFAEPTSTEELIQLVRSARDQNVPVRTLGGGSNVLVREGGVPGLVIHLTGTAFASVTPQPDGLKLGGGTRLSEAVAASLREGFVGLEQLVGIPGTVGGAVRGNAGVQSASIGAFVSSVTALTDNAELRTYQRSDLHFSYRGSNVDDVAILDVTLELQKGDIDAATKRMQKLWIERKSRQPESMERAAYVFKDPGGLTAAEALEQAGLKGAGVGEASFSNRQPNFIVVGDKATSEHVLRLIDLAKAQVFDRLGIDLETQLAIW